MGHHLRDCPTGFPLGKGYKTLVLADALAVKTKEKSTFVASSSASSSKQTSKAVAATAPDSDDEPTAITAILPSISDYTSDSEEDADISKRDVSAPLKSKHLIWHCHIHSLIDDFPVKTCALIDNGAHIVLICPELVQQLRLKKCQLQT